MVLLALLSACASADRYAGLGADELWVAGLEAYEDGEWSDAIDAFQRLLTQSPGHPNAPEARMHMAQAHMERGEHLSAADTYERFLVLHFNHPHGPEASLGVCRAYAALAPIPPRDQTYTRRARDACLETTLEFQGLNVAQEAEALWFEMVDRLAERVYDDGRFYQRRGIHTAAILYFERLASDYPDFAWAHRGLLQMYRSYQELGWEEEAEETAARLFNRYPESDSARELRAERGMPDTANGTGGR